MTGMWWIYLLFWCFQFIAPVHSNELVDNNHDCLWLQQKIGPGTICDDGFTDPRPQCRNPTYQDCQFYVDCVDFYFPECSKPEDNYAKRFGEYYCKRFDANLFLFTSKGKKWIAAVKTCLQKAIEKMVPTLPKLTCAQLKRQAFDSHVECYNRPAPGVSFCKLCQDILAVMYTVGVSKPIYGSLGNFGRVGKDAIIDCVKGEHKAQFITCLINGAVEFGPPAFRVARRFVKLGIKGYRLLRTFINKEKRSIQCDQTCLAEKITTSLFEKANLSDSITWFVLDNQLEDEVFEIKVFVSDLNVRKANTVIENTTVSSLNMTLIDSAVEKVMKAATQGSELEVSGELIQIDSFSNCDDVDCNNTIAAAHLLQPTTTTKSSGMIASTMSIWTYLAALLWLKELVC